MAKTKTPSTTNQKKVQDYRSYQEELLNLSQQYSQARLAVWAQEAQSLHDSWNSLSQDWQSNLDQMAAVSGNEFTAMAAQGQAAANLMGQSWQQNLTAVSGSLDQWGENFLNTLTKAYSRRPLVEPIKTAFSSNGSSHSGCAMSSQQEQGHSP